MNAVPFKTRAEQTLEHLTTLKRPLTDEESDLLRRSLHAVYCYKRNAKLQQHRNEELETLRNVEREAVQPERYRHEIR